MKYKSLGSCFNVSVNAAEIECFANKWPCSGLRGMRRICAQFESNGDLVDISPANLEERGANGAALLALVSDMQTYGEKQRGAA